jgi:hypothetical protein
MPLFGRGRAEEAASATVICPSCQEPAPTDALLCPHCKGVLPPRPQSVEVATAGPGSPLSSPGGEQASRETEQTAGTGQ